MFVSQNHNCHDEKWLFPGLNEGSATNTYQCVACLIDTIGDINVSRVQREVALCVLSSMVKHSSTVTDALVQNFNNGLGICNLIFGELDLGMILAWIKM